MLSNGELLNVKPVKKLLIRFAEMDFKQQQSFLKSVHNFKKGEDENFLDDPDITGEARKPLIQ